MRTVAYAYKNTPELLSISSSGGAFLGIVHTFSEKFAGGVLDIRFMVPDGQMIFE